MIWQVEKEKTNSNSIHTIHIRQSAISRALRVFLAAVLLCMPLSSCSDSDAEPAVKAEMQALYGKNREIFGCV